MMKNMSEKKNDMKLREEGGSSVWIPYEFFFWGGEVWSI